VEGYVEVSALKGVRLVLGEGDAPVAEYLVEWKVRHCREFRSFSRA
jgi:hypothetical protein